MRKRKLCSICLPVLCWLLLAGVAGYRKSEEISWPWQEGSILWVKGIIEQIQTKEEKQIIYIKHISISVFNDSESQYSTDDTKAKIKIELQRQEDLQIGNYVQVKGCCQYFAKAENDGGFDARKYYASQSVFLALKEAEILTKNRQVDWIREICRRIREKGEKQLESMLQREESGVMASLLFGDKSGLDTEIRDLYQKNGIIHVLAVSGLHISLIGMSFFQFLRKRRVGFVPAAFCAGGVIWFYGVLTGFPVSGVRAVIMFYLFLGAQISGRTTDLPTSMTIAAVLMLIQNPQRVTECGFLLSFAAVSGVAVASAFPQTHKGWAAFRVSLCTWIMTLPVVAYFYYQVPVFGIFLNLLVVPSMSLLVGCAVLGMLVGMLNFSAGMFLIAPVHYLLQATFFLCRICAGIPGAVWTTGKPSLLQIGLYYLIFIIAMTFFLKTEKIDLIKMTFGIILGIGILFYRGSQNWSITFLSVGQGDGICIQTHQKHVWMMDGGSSTQSKLAKYCLEPYFRYWGIQKVDGWLLSHFDQDHVSGLLQILETYDPGMTGKNRNGVTIGTILIPDTTSDGEWSDRILELARKYQIPVRRLCSGDEVEQDDMKITVINPDREESYESQNAGSMVVKVTYDSFCALLTGDVEGTGEKQLEKSTLKDVDVLKVAHHGSKNSSTEEVLEKMRGKIAVISCGRGNRYGHPHRELLERLKKNGYQVLRTDLDGMIRFCVEKKG